MTTRDTMTIDSYLATCAQIEQTVSDIYRHWSNTREFPREMQSLWQRMAEEETTQAEQIEMQRRLLRNQHSHSRNMTEARVLALSAFVRDCLIDIRSTPMSLRETLVLAIRIENRCSDFLADQAVHLDDCSLKQVFRLLSSREESHTRSLYEHYFERFTDQ